MKTGNHAEPNFWLVASMSVMNFISDFLLAKSQGHAFGEISAQSVWGALSKSFSFQIRSFKGS